MLQDTLRSLQAEYRVFQRGILDSGIPESHALEAVEGWVNQLRVSSNQMPGLPKTKRLRQDINRQCSLIDDRLLELRGLRDRNVIATHSVPECELNCDPYFTSPVDEEDELVQVTMFVGIVCSAIFMLSRDMTGVIIGMVKIAISSALRIRTRSGTSHEQMLLDAVPKDQRTLLSKFNLSGKTTIYASCSKCHMTYEPRHELDLVTLSYPETCTNRRRPDDGICGANLVTRCSVGRKGTVIQRPIQPYVYHSVLDYIGTLFSHEDLERYIDNACDATAVKVAGKQHQRLEDIFGGTFLGSFRGPDPDVLFLDRGQEGRLAFSLNVDFFNIHGNRAGGAAASCGIISLACLNLPPEMRFRRENLHIVGIIPGPHEPDLEAINAYTRPLIDDMVVLWNHGVRLSRTALHRHGRLIRAAIICVVCDLPAARKVAALAGHRSNKFLCSICKVDREHIAHPSHSPARRDVFEMRQKAQEWKDAPTSALQDRVFDCFGVRYSELFRLPYWDPTKQLVVDPMHNLLLGITENHFKNVLRLTVKRERTSVANSSPAFLHDFTPISGLHGLSDDEIKDIAKIHKMLTTYVDASNRNDLKAREAFTKRLCNHRKNSLRFVLDDLQLQPEIPEGQSRVVKEHFAKSLTNWRFSMSLAPSNACVESTLLNDLLQHIRRVIKETTTPTWISSVPRDFGDPKCGKLKADEWKVLCTIHLPLALVSWWGEGTKHASEDISQRCREIVDHTMLLVSAVTIACKRSTTADQIARYERYVKEYIVRLRKIHPNAKLTTNLHMATHIGEFMRLFGPTHSWWCFPFERLIGFLQKMPNNNKFGQLESSVHDSFVAFSRIKLWSSKPGCPIAIKECRRIYDKLYPDNLDRSQLVDHDEQAENEDDRVCSRKKPVSLSRYCFRGRQYSTDKCHTGNSLVLVRSKDEVEYGDPCVIEDIFLDDHDKVKFRTFLGKHSRQNCLDGLTRSSLNRSYVTSLAFGYSPT
ncbi:hypothetical protein ACEPAG_9351 [Sanghuangporus baumii]